MNIPKYFAVKCDRSLEFKAFINWFNRKYSVNYGGDSLGFYYGIGGSGTNGTNWSMDKDVFRRGTIFFETAKEFMDLYFNHKKITHKKITHNQAQDIINVACYDWKVELANLWGRSIVLKEIISITGDFYKKMRAACNKEQHVLFDEIFGVDKPVIDYDRLKTGSVVNIQYTAKYCAGGVSNNVIKNLEAATIIFYKEKHGITTNGEFLDVDSLGGDLYITFQQGKQFLLFKFDDELACIVDVLKY